jgi:hypothetical protein
MNRHPEQLGELLSRVDRAQPHLHAVSYHELIDEWSNLSSRSWIAEHIHQLEDRYSLSI